MGCITTSCEINSSWMGEVNIAPASAPLVLCYQSIESTWELRSSQKHDDSPCGTRRIGKPVMVSTLSPLLASVTMLHILRGINSNSEKLRSSRHICRVCCHTPWWLGDLIEVEGEFEICDSPWWQLWKRPLDHLGLIARNERKLFCRQSTTME